MRRPHPYLAIALVCAAVVLATAAAVARPARAEVGMSPAPPRTPDPVAPPAQTCLPYIHGSIVWPGSPECADQRGGDALHVPTEQRLRSIRYATAQILWGDLRSGALATEATQAEQQAAWVLAQEAVPVYHDGPICVKAATPPGYEPTCGDYWCGCASGVGTWPPKIDVSQPLRRVEQLVAWEITNAFLSSIRRPDLWDGPYVSSVPARVGAAIGGWSD